MLVIIDGSTSINYFQEKYTPLPALRWCIKPIHIQLIVFILSSYTVMPNANMSNYSTHTYDKNIHARFKSWYAT